tara:strand:+ start:35 stop:565 length:531 start_codon:yes stop_codon:yes gene_type:complete
MNNNIRSLRVFERHFYDNNYPAQIDYLNTQIATKQNDEIREGQLIYNILHLRDFPEEEYISWIQNFIGLQPYTLGVSGFELYLNEISNVIENNIPGPPNTPAARNFYYGPNHPLLKNSIILKRQINVELVLLRRQLAKIRALSTEKKKLEKLAKVSQTRRTLNRQRDYLLNKYHTH